MRSVRWALALALLLAVPVLARGDDDAATTAGRAADAYAAGDYDAAATTYGALTWERGSRDADVWYNAGNAYARAGQRGAAIAAYRVALMLAPRHTDAAVNLAYLRTQVDVAPASPDGSFFAWLLRPAAWVAPAWWRRLGLGAWAAVWVLLAVRVWRPHRWRLLLFAAAAVCMAGAAGWGAARIGRGLQPRAIVVAPVAPLRTGPGPDYLLTYSLPDGAECVLLNRQAGWAQLQLSDGATGWTEAERILTLPLGEPTPSRAPARWKDST